MRTSVRLLLLSCLLAASSAWAGLPITPQLSIYSPTPSFDFGAVPVGSNRPLAIGLAAPGTNSATVVVTALTTTGDFTESGNCVGTPVAAGASCNLVETFIPTGPGLRAGTVSITCFLYALPIVGTATFACNGTPYIVNLIGFGGVVAAVPAMQPTLVAVLAAALMGWGMLFVARRQRARRR